MATHRAKPAAFTDAASVEAALSSPTTDKDLLAAIAASAALTEDLALTFLKRRDLPHQALEALAKNGRALKSRKVKCAVVEHPRAPRHVSLPLMRHMYTFELMQISLLPGVAADLKLALEDVLIGRVVATTDYGDERSAFCAIEVDGLQTKCIVPSKLCLPLT